MNKTRIKRLLILLARLDKLLLLLQLLLMATGVIFIYGAGQEVGGTFSGYWKRQLLWSIVGGGCFLCVALIDYRTIATWSWLGYGLGVVLLIMLYPFGIVLNGARSWLPMPGTSATVQPAEFAKPATLLFSAWLLSRPFLKKTGLVSLTLLGIAVGIPFGLILCQPDYGTALVYVPCTAAMVFAAGLPWRWVTAAVLAVVLSVPLAYPHLRNHQKDRLKVFLEPPVGLIVDASQSVISEPGYRSLVKSKEKFFERSSDALSSDWNAHQSLLAVGSGGMWGKGFMHGTQHVLGFLPRTVAPTDFIFSVIAEEVGFMGASAVVCSFIALILCMIRTAMLSRDELGSYLAVGVAVVFFTHAFINIGMTMQAAPIIGIPLPFVSYGGSFMVGTMILTGLVQSVHVRRKRH